MDTSIECLIRQQETYVVGESAVDMPQGLRRAVFLLCLVACCLFRIANSLIAWEKKKKRNRGHQDNNRDGDKHKTQKKLDSAELLALRHFEA